MTRPIPLDGDRQRSERACAACRAAKCKCISLTPTSLRCTRCERLERECNFLPSNRHGRPRRLPKSLPAPKGSDATQDSNSPAPSPDSANTSANAGDHHSVFEPDIEGCPADFLEAVAFCDFTPLHGGPSQQFADLATLATQYQLHVHPFVSILPTNYDALLALLKSAPDTLVSAVRCITFPDPAHLPNPVLRPTLSDIQAGVLLVHVHYGHGDSDTACLLLQAISRHLLDLEWHLIDAACAPPTLAEDELESIRRVWWECWALETRLAIVTGTRDLILGVPFSVNYPKPLGYDDDLSPQTLKIRALSVGRDCMAPSELKLSARISALTTIATNIYTTARLAWTRATQSASCDSPARAVRREEAFEAVMLASASIIYLHMTSYASCIFICGVDTTRTIPPTAVLDVRQASRSVFTLLRESLAYPGMAHSAFTSCCLLTVAHGSILTIALGGESEQWNMASVASDLQLGEMIMKEQAPRWPVAARIVEELRRLSFELCSGIEGRDIRLMLGIH